eukprot:UN03335
MTPIQRTYKWESDGYEFKDRLKLKEDKQREQDEFWKKPQRPDSRVWQPVADDPTLPDGNDPIKELERERQPARISRDGHYYDQHGALVK